MVGFLLRALRGEGPKLQADLTTELAKLNIVLAVRDSKGRLSPLTAQSTTGADAGVYIDRQLIGKGPVLPLQRLRGGDYDVLVVRPISLGTADRRATTQPFSVSHEKVRIHESEERRVRIALPDTTPRQFVNAPPIRHFSSLPSVSASTRSSFLSTAEHDVTAIRAARNDWSQRRLAFEVDPLRQRLENDYNSLLNDPMPNASLVIGKIPWLGTVNGAYIACGQV